MKMPDPMMPPITIIVASNRPSARVNVTSSGSSSTRKSSWIQAFDTPPTRFADIEHTIVQPVRASVPEFDPRGHQTKASPERRTLHGLCCEPPLDLAILLFQRFARGKDL